MSPSSPQHDWSLHPQLAQDSIELGDLPLSQVLICNDANFPWLMLVPRRPDASELIDLAAPDQTQLMTEIAIVSRALKDVTGCHKLNVAALGNSVAQLHVHVVARMRHDPVWPKPIWGQLPAKPYARSALDAFAAALKQKIWPT
jgi:diadenosine tetraphosphate (Ap4A) HIT family hydrolase